MEDRKKPMMDERFPYGYDVQVYLDKAFEQLKETMFWATKEMLDDRYVYTIEQENGVYNFVSYYKQDDGGTQRSVLDYCDWKGFIDHWVFMNDWYAEKHNPVKEYMGVEASNKMSCGWALEIYQIRKHELGNFSVYVQAGNRSAGASKTYYIPQDYLKLPWEEFLDKYIDLVATGSCYVTRNDIEETEGLKEFLGFKVG